MSSNAEVHFQIIRIALGYSLLGIFVITALVCVLSFIRIPLKTARPRPLVGIEPPWLRKSLYTSLIVHIVTAAALFWKNLIAVDTTQMAQHVQTTIERQGVEVASRDIKSIGILRYWQRAND